ncbi:MAG: hypothetical protein ABJM58_09330 [Alteripontixanthobacter sp.]
MRRPRTAAAARPNRIIIGGAGTCVPLLVPPELDEELPELLPDDELLEPLLDEEEEDEDDELEVELVMLPELPPVDIPLVLIPPLEEPDEEDDEDELLELLDDEDDPPVLPLVVVLPPFE